MFRFLRFFSLPAILLASVLLSAAGDTDFSKVKIYGRTNKSALSYKVGEPMVFTFKADLNGVSPDGLFLYYVRRGDDGKRASGIVPATQELTVRTSIDRPGFVNVDVVLATPQKKTIFYKTRSGARRPVAFFAGTAAEPEKLTDCGEPADFDEFWKKQLARLKAVPFKGLTDVKYVNSVSGYEVYAVSIPCAGGRPTTGYMGIPENAAEKSLPIELDFSGYGPRRQYPPKKINGKRIYFYINAHGQELGREDAYYEKFFQSIRSNGYSYAFDPEQNKDPETAFFNGMVLRLLRALEYLKTRPEWNGKDIRLESMSQGGLHVVWGAALDPDVTYAAPSITWCCDMAGTAKAGRLHGSWRVPYSPGVDYYDPVFMAKRIKTAKVEIKRVGLGDYISPPSGQAIFFRNLATPDKSIRWVQGSDHDSEPLFSEVIVWKTSF